MNILLFTQSLENSAGIERMTVSLANELVNREYKVTIIVCGVNLDTFYTLDERVTLHALGYSFNNRIMAAYKLHQLIKLINPDVFINVAVPMGQISFLSLAFLRNKPVVVGWEHFHLYAGSKLGQYFKLLSAFLCNYTVVLTDCDKSNYPKLLQKKIQRIYNFTKLSPQYYLRNESNTVLTVGRLEPQKGYDLLLPIWKIVVENISNCKLLIVGSGSMKEKLQQQIIKLGLSNVVSILPPSSKIIDYYKQSSLYVMTSRYEGLPMVLIEAKACGMACISYDCPQGPNEIIRDSIDGYIIPMNNAELYAQQLTKLLQNPRLVEQFGKGAVSDINNRFSVDVIIKQWEDLFSRLKSK